MAQLSYISKYLTKNTVKPCKFKIGYIKTPRKLRHVTFTTFRHTIFSTL